MEANTCTERTGARRARHHARHAAVQDATVRLLAQRHHVPPAAQAQAAHLARPLPARDLVPADFLLLHPHAGPGPPGTRSVTMFLTMFATLSSHCCYTVVTLLLHCCYTVVTLLFHAGPGQTKTRSYVAPVMLLSCFAMLLRCSYDAFSHVMLSCYLLSLRTHTHRTH
jgi:hypothetical protein